MRGLFYSVMMAFIIIPILGLIFFYSQSGTTNIDTDIRANELQYFSKSIESDLVRFLQINGKRALIAAVSNVITNGTGLDNAQLRLTEMIENGTLYGSANNAPLVNEKNLMTWEQNISDIASGLGFSIEFKNVEINITQSDSFNVLFNTTLCVNISDSTAQMGILKNITAPVNVSIENIEDPIFPLKTYGRVFRFIRISNSSKNTVPLVTGQNASGLPDNTITAYAFVKSAASLVVGDANSSRIVVTNDLTGTGKASIAAGFAGVVSENDIIIPTVLIGKSITGATGAMNLIKNETKIYLDKTTMQIWDLSNLTSDIKNVDKNYYHYYHNSSAGASFLDRLEGRTNLSAKYKYGLETFVNPSDWPSDVPFINTNSFLDYKYWNNTLGSPIRNGNYDPVFNGLNQFRIDFGSAYDYGISILIG